MRWTYFFSQSKEFSLLLVFLLFFRSVYRISHIIVQSQLKTEPEQHLHWTEQKKKTATKTPSSSYNTYSSLVQTIEAPAYSSHCYQWKTLGNNKCPAKFFQFKARAFIVAQHSSKFYIERNFIVFSHFKCIVLYRENLTVGRNVHAFFGGQVGESERESSSALFSVKMLMLTHSTNCRQYILLKYTYNNRKNAKKIISLVVTFYFSVVRRAHSIIIHRLLTVWEREQKKIAPRNQRSFSSSTQTGIDLKRIPLMCCVESFIFLCLVFFYQFAVTPPQPSLIVFHQITALRRHPHTNQLICLM